MPIYTLTLKDKETIADNTVCFHFEKPEGFQFTPGQYGGFTIMNPVETDEKGNTRRFSIVSAPHDKHLTIVTRIQTSAFKRNLMALPINSTVKFGGPTGQFILPADKNVPLILIAGGVGIAPFYSMIRHHYEIGEDRKITLFYGNQTISSSAFLNELSALSESHPNFQFVPLLDRADATQPWQGEIGYITHQVIERYIPQFLQHHFYVCGAPVMVKAILNTLTEMTIPTEQIQFEDFPGY